MRLVQRREELRGELVRLLSIITEYHLSCPSSQVENPFIQELEAQLQRKTAEMEALNELYKSPIFRFRAACFDMKLPIWFMAIVMCAAALFLGPLLGGSLSVIFVICAVLSLIWAIWSSRELDF